MPQKQKSKTDELMSGLKSELEETEKKIEDNRAVLRDLHNRTEAANLKSIQAENKLHEIEGQIKQTEAAYKSKLASLDELNKGHAGRKETIEREIDVLKSDKADLIAKKRSLTIEIKEREAYQKEQEAKVNEVVENANDRIIQLNHEASEMEGRNSQLAISFNDMEHQTNELEVLIRQREAQLATLNEQYESVNRTYQQTLTGLKSRIDSANAEYKLQVESGKKIVEKLAIKEKELKAREKIINDREYKVGEEERMWTHRHRLYDKQEV